MIHDIEDWLLLEELILRSVVDLYNSRSKDYPTDLNL
jgi:hypothetical protein